MDPPDHHHPYPQQLNKPIPLCEYCGVQRALVYCKADAARLCLPCDLHVHSANALSCRHLRALICDRCAAHLAAVRLPDDSLSLCAACQWSVVANNGQGHRRCWPINCYSGCPTLPQQSRILAAGNDDESCAGGGGGINMMTINEKCESTCRENVYVVGMQQEMDPWMVAALASASASASGSSVLPPGAGDQQHNKSNIATALAYPQFRNTGICDDDGIFDGFNPSNASSSGQYDSTTLPSTCLAGSAGTLHTINSNSDQMLLSLQSNRNVSMNFSSGKVCQSMSLSLSNLTGESRVADSQDCGVSPMFLSGESPWDSNIETSRPQARNEAKLRYIKKKKSRLFGKQIRCASRKARADTRKHVKGRFVKAGEAYDCDPVLRSS